MTAAPTPALHGACASAAERAVLEGLLQSADATLAAEAGTALAWHLRQLNPSRARQLAAAAAERPDARQRQRAGRLALIEAEHAWLQASLHAAASRAEAVVAAAADDDNALVADAHLLGALIAVDRGQMQAGDAHLQRAAAAAQRAGDATREALALAVQGYASAGGHLDEADRLWAQRMAGWRGSGQPLLAMWAHDHLGQMERRRGRFVAAIAAYDTVCRLALDLGQLRRAITACANICTNHLNLNDPASALAWAEKGLALARPGGWPASMGSCLALLGRVLTVLGRHDAAREALDEAQQVVAPLRGSRTAVIATYYASELARDRGDHAAAAHSLQAMVADAESAGVRDLAQMGCIGLAKAQLALQQLPQALATAEKAHAMARQDRSRGTETAALTTLANVHRALALQAHAGSAAAGAASAAAAAASLPFRQRAVEVAASIAHFSLDAAHWDALAGDLAALGRLEEAYAAARQGAAVRDAARKGELARRAMGVAAHEQLDRAQTERLQQQADAEREAALADDVSRTHDTLRQLARIGQDLVADRDMDRALHRLHSQLSELLDAPGLAVWLHDAVDGALHLRFGVDAGKVVTHAAARPAVGSAEFDCLHGRAEVLRALAGGGSVLAGPLALADQVVGVMSITSPTSDAYGERERLLFRSLCAHAAIALENDRVLQELRAAGQALQASHEAERASRERAQEAAAQRSQFLAQIARDLRAPLAALQATMATLIDDAACARATVDGTALALAQQQSRVVNDLARVLLDLARLEATAVDLALEPFSLADLVHDLVHQTGAGAGGGEPVVRVHMHGRPAPVLADIGLTERALAALLQCALQGGAADGTVRVSMDFDDAHARVLVQHCMPAEQVAPAPAAADSVRLAIARRVLRLHGRALQHLAISDGSRAWAFELPVAPA